MTRHVFPGWHGSFSPHFLNMSNFSIYLRTAIPAIPSYTIQIYPDLSKRTLARTLSAGQAIHPAESLEEWMEKGLHRVEDEECIWLEGFAATRTCRLMLGNGAKHAATSCQHICTANSVKHSKTVKPLYTNLSYNPL